MLKGCHSKIHQNLRYCLKYIPEFSERGFARFYMLTACLVFLGFTSNQFLLLERSKQVLFFSNQKGEVYWKLCWISLYKKENIFPWQHNGISMKRNHSELTCSVSSVFKLIYFDLSSRLTLSRCTSHFTVPPLKMLK